MAKLCDRCPVSGCLLDYLGKACCRVREKECPDIQPNNAEKISVMDVDSMATAIIKGLHIDDSGAKEEVRKWLTAEVKGET